MALPPNPNSLPGPERLTRAINRSHWNKRRAFSRSQAQTCSSKSPLAVTDQINAERERDRLMAELQHHAAEFDGVFQAIPDGILIYSASGKLLHINPAAERMLNLSEQDIQASISGRIKKFQIKDADGHPLTDPTQVPAYRAMRGERVVNQVMKLYLPETSNHLWVSISASPVHDVEGVGAVVSLTDITDRMELENALNEVHSHLEKRVAERTAELMSVNQDLIATNEALRQSEERFLKAFDGNPEAVCISRLADGRLMEVNDRYMELFEYPDDELIGHTSTELNMYPDPSERAAMTRKLTDEGSVRDYEMTTRAKSGKLLRVLVSTLPIELDGEKCILSTILDISHRKQVEEEIRTLNQMLESRVEERTRELTTLLSISNNLSATLEREQLLKVILDQIKMIVDYSGAMVILKEQERFEVVAVRSPSFQKPITPMNAPVELDQNLKTVTETRTPLIINNSLDRPPVIPINSDEVLENVLNDWENFCSWLGVPIVVKDQVNGILLLTHQLSSTFTGNQPELVMAIANQGGVALENTRLYQQAHQLAAVNERQRLARELHDSISQALYGISLGTHVALATYDRDPGKMKEALEYILSLADAGLTEMRALIFELHPESLEKEGLVAALTRYAAALQARRGIQVKTDLGDEPDLTIDYKEALYRISQEALQNASRHANPTTIIISLNTHGEMTRLSISDNGKGFDPSQTFSGHLGLQSMRERVQQLHGALEIHSAPGSGTAIQVSFARPAPKDGDHLEVLKSRSI